MKSNYTYMVIACVLVGSGTMIYLNGGNSSETSANNEKLATNRSAKHIIHDHEQCALPHNTFVAKKIAKDGMLWEKTVDGLVNHRVSVPLDAKSLAGFSDWKKGAKVSLPVSEKFPAIEGVVKHTGVQADGTVIAHVLIPGNPTGHLMLQENKAVDFFHGQIIYDDYPVAYQLSKTGNAMDITRTSIEGVTCSLADFDHLEVQAGLPLPGDVARARGGNGGGNGGGGKPDGGGGGGGPKGKSPTMSISGSSVNEGDTGSVSIQFSVTLNKASTSTITVNYATANGSATAGSDYTAASGTLTFAAGETAKNIDVSVLGDTVDEEDETFAVNLSNPVGAKSGSMSANGTIIDDEAPSSNVPVLNSRPGAMAVVYLDMDGETVSNTYWNDSYNGGQPIVVTGVDTLYSSSKMTAIWQQVVEDFTPFNINVTTDEAVYLAAPSNRRIRCIITPDYEWFGQAGGVAYLNSFVWTGDTPCWVFTSLLGNSAKNIAEASSHEVGHTLGLYHDGRTNPNEGYYYGHGSGATGWAPIMGVGYNRSLVQWSKGEYGYADNTEDDLAIITSQNGFGYRGDDHGNNDSSATSVSNNKATGVIETRSDVDVFAVTTSGGAGTISVTGASPSSNLDVLVELYDSQGTLVASSNPADQLTASIVTTLAAGTYYVRVSGIGKGDPVSTGYTDYGSLGEYTVTTTLP